MLVGVKLETPLFGKHIVLQTENLRYGHSTICSINKIIVLCHLFQANNPGPKSSNL